MGEAARNAISPFAPDFDVSLVNPPLPAHPALHLGRIFLDPAIDCAVIDANTGLCHHGFQIAIADPIKRLLLSR